MEDNTKNLQENANTLENWINNLNNDLKNKQKVITKLESKANHMMDIKEK